MAAGLRVDFVKAGVATADDLPVCTPQIFIVQYQDRSGGSLARDGEEVGRSKGLTARGLIAHHTDLDLGRQAGQVIGGPGDMIAVALTPDSRRGDARRQRQRDGNAREGRRTGDKSRHVFIPATEDGDQAAIGQDSRSRSSDTLRRREGTAAQEATLAANARL